MHDYLGKYVTNIVAKESRIHITVIRHFHYFHFLRTGSNNGIDSSCCAITIGSSSSPWYISVPLPLFSHNTRAKCLCLGARDIESIYSFPSVFRRSDCRLPRLGGSDVNRLDFPYVIVTMTTALAVDLRVVLHI